MIGRFGAAEAPPSLNVTLSRTSVATLTTMAWVSREMSGLLSGCLAHLRGCIIRPAGLAAEVFGPWHPFQRDNESEVLSLQVTKVLDHSPRCDRTLPAWRCNS